MLACFNPVADFELCSGLFGFSLHAELPFRHGRDPDGEEIYVERAVVRTGQCGTAGLHMWQADEGVQRHSSLRAPGFLYSRL